MRSRETLALTGFTAVLAITVAWWALALWPLDSDAPAWMVRAQAVCFNTRANGLPDPSGWLALVLQPAIMFVILAVIAGDALTSAARSMGQRFAGRLALAGLALLVPVSAGAVAWRVATAPHWLDDVAIAAAPLPDNYPRLDRETPALALVNQHGERVTLDRFHGQPVLITFAFAHCETVCPIVVHDVLEARSQLRDPRPVALVVTLDPWRDTPSRLPAIARQWQLGEDGYVLSGTVDEVEAALDAWNVARQRDLTTGDIIHPRLVYIVDTNGQLAYAVNGGSDAIMELVERL